MLFDPIFQGLAISLMTGEVAATFLSRLAVPVVYFLIARREPRRGSEAGHDPDALADGTFDRSERAEAAHAEAA
jgi:hypothetical protein